MKINSKRLYVVMGEIYRVMCQRNTDHELLQNGSRDRQDDVEQW